MLQGFLGGTGCWRHREGHQGSGGFSHIQRTRQTQGRYRRCDSLVLQCMCYLVKGFSFDSHVGVGVGKKVYSRQGPERDIWMNLDRLKSHCLNRHLDKSVLPYKSRCQLLDCGLAVLRVRMSQQNGQLFITLTIVAGCRGHEPDQATRQCAQAVPKMICVEHAIVLMSMLIIACKPYAAAIR